MERKDGEKKVGKKKAARAADRRKWKKRWNTLLIEDIINHIIRTKKARPTPADLVKTAATKFGIILSYKTAYRALTHERRIEKNAVMNNFEMVIPFLERMKG